jgi:hypothetical protein
LSASPSTAVRAQGKPSTAKNLRCDFRLITTGTWNSAGSPEAAVKPSSLVLRFDSINTDEGTVVLRNGTVGTELTAQLAARNLHFIQSFRSGPLYVTTVFDQETTGGKLRAVHSRHESFKTPLEGATSSPEQYYGECEIVN